MSAGDELLMKVHLYHSSKGALWECCTPRARASTGPPLTATLATTNSNRHEIQIRDFPDLDPVVSIDLRLVKRCVVRKNTWIELTDSKGLVLALDCAASDPGFVAFSQRLVTLMKLMHMKVEMNNSLDKAKWVLHVPSSRSNDDDNDNLNVAAASPVSDTSNRPLPPLPFNSPTPNDDEWPLLPPPPVPSPSSPTSGYSTPHLREASCSTTVVRPFNTDENGYLIPKDSGNRKQIPKVTNDGVRRVEFRRSMSSPRGVASTEDWTCSRCTLDNGQGSSRCSACDEPRNLITRGRKTEERKTEERKTEGRKTEGRKTEERKTEGRRSDFTECVSCRVSLSAKCPRCQVDRWRCEQCGFLNCAEAFSCGECDRNREDAWQCHVCSDVISLSVTRCSRCDVWRCQLCSCQNDARENASRRCGVCQQ